MVHFKTGKLPSSYKNRTAYLLRFQQVVINFHNEKGKEFRDGEISEETFRNFQENWCKPRLELIATKLADCKHYFKEDATIAVNSDDIED